MLASVSPRSHTHAALNIHFDVSCVHSDRFIMRCADVMACHTPPQVSMVCLDFDGTCTEDDTMTLLPALAAEAARSGLPPPKDGKEGGGKPMSPDEV